MAQLRSHTHSFFLALRTVAGYSGRSKAVHRSEAREPRARERSARGSRPTRDPLPQSMTARRPPRQTEACRKSPLECEIGRPARGHPGLETSLLKSRFNSQEQLRHSHQRPPAWACHTRVPRHAGPVGSQSLSCDEVGIWGCHEGLPSPEGIKKRPDRTVEARNSPSWTRTSNLAVNSRSLYQLSYRGLSSLKA